MQTGRKKPHGGVRGMQSSENLLIVALLEQAGVRRVGDVQRHGGGFFGIVCAVAVRGVVVRWSGESNRQLNSRQVKLPTVARLWRPIKKLGNQIEVNTAAALAPQQSGSNGRFRIRPPRPPVPAFTGRGSLGSALLRAIQRLSAALYSVS